MTKKNLAIGGALLIGGLAIESASADPTLITDGLYRLHNHPDGLIVPPQYGLRLDSLVDLFPGNDKFTFSFDELPNGDGADAAMFADVNSGSGTVHIYGRVWGGLDTGGAYDPTNSGYWDVDFAFTTGVTVPIDIGGGMMDNDLAVLHTGGFPPNPNGGTLTPAFVDPDFASSYTLSDYAGGNQINGADYSFRFGNDTDDLGYRDFDGISGWGWLVHSGNPTAHVEASDFLFTAEPIPAPGAVVLGWLGMVMVSGVARRTRRS